MASVIRFALVGVVVLVVGGMQARADIVPGTSSTDLFDSTQGTIVVSSDAIIDPINAFRTSGGFEDGHTLMRNGGIGSVSFINFDTLAAVSIKGVRLFAHNDGAALGFRRAMSHFKLLADTDGDTIFETLVVDTAININYAIQPNNNATDPTNLDLTLPTGGPVTARHWRLEVTQGTNVQPFEGARLVELDGPAGAPTTISKAFGTPQIPLNTSTTLSFTLANAAGNTVALTGVGFSDTLPAGLVVATPNGLTGSCGAGTITATAGSSSISLSGATLPVGASCTFSVDVTGTTAGVKNNLSGRVTSTNGGSGGTAAASITVVAPPTISKAFGTPQIPLNTSTTLGFTLANPAGNTVALTGVGFSDTLPAGLVVATPNGLTGSCGAGTITATAGSSSISLSGATLPVGASCTFSVDVTGTTAGVKNNTTDPVKSTEGGTDGTASASITVVAPPTISKALPPRMLAGFPGNLTLTISNPNATIGLTGIAVTDPLPSGMTVSQLVSNTCGGSVTAVLESSSVSLSGGSLAASGTCSVVVSVVSSVPGDKNNTTGNVTSNEGGTDGTASATTKVLPTVVAPALSLWGMVGLAALLNALALRRGRDSVSRNPTVSPPTR